jgi:hypothetical protein
MPCAGGSGAAAGGFSAADFAAVLGAVFGADFVAGRGTLAITYASQLSVGQVPRQVSR